MNRIRWCASAMVIAATVYAQDLSRQPRAVLASTFDALTGLQPRGQGGYSIRDILARDGGVFFIVQSPGGGILMHSDLKGSIRYSIALGPSVSDVVDWATGGRGDVQIAVEVDQGARTELRHYSAGGELLAVSPVSGGVYHAATTEGFPLRVMRSGEVIRRTGASATWVARIPITHLNRFATSTLRLPENKMAIIDAVDAELTIVDLQSGAFTSSAIRDPDVERVKAGYATARDAQAGRDGITVRRRRRTRAEEFTAC